MGIKSARANGAKKFKPTVNCKKILQKSAKFLSQTLLKLTLYFNKQFTMSKLFSKKSLLIILANGVLLNSLDAVAQTTYSPVSTSTQQDKDWNHQFADMTGNSDGLIDRQQSLQMGEWALRQLQGEAPLVSDPWLHDSLQEVAWQLSSLALADAPLGLAIIKDRTINAFAIPAGVFGVNVGLLDKARNLDEVASVLSHEIAHVSQRHYQNRNNEKTKQLLMQVGGMLAGIAASKADSGAGVAVMASAQAMSANTAAAFSRSQEQEADRIGMQIMAQAGYDVNAMPNFFALMNQENQVKANAFIPSFVLSHPLTADRLSEARLRAATYHQTTAIQAQNNDLQNARKALFDQMQWRARYLANLVTKNDLIAASNSSNGAKLALAKQYIDERDFINAQKLLNSFSNQIATLTLPLAVITQANLETAQGQHAQAITRLTALHNLMPERRDVVLYLVDAVLAKGNATPAELQSMANLLQPFSRQNPRDIQIWQRLQQLSQQLAKSSQDTAKTIQEINVLRYRANIEFWQNDLETSVTTLTQAKKLAQNLTSKSLLAVINEQLKQVQAANKYKPS